MTWTTPRDWTDQQLVTAALMNEQLRDNLDFLHDEHLPQRAIMWHLNSIVVSGGSITLIVETAQLFNHYAKQSNPINGNTFTQSCYLQAGTYKFQVLGVKAATLGKVDWYLDNAALPFVAGQDWYAGTTYNVLQPTTDVAIGESGVHVLKGVVNGQNTYSNGYALFLTAMWFQPSTD